MILAILAIAVFLIVRSFLRIGGGEDVIFTWNSDYTQQLDCVIIRDEYAAL